MTRPIAFADNPLDRAASLRRHAEPLAAALAAPGSRFLVLRQLKLPVLPGGHPGNLMLDWRPAAEIAPLIEAGAAWVLLGLDGDRARFAIDGSALPENWAHFDEARQIAVHLAPGESGIAAQARSLLDWHARHRFCASCGHATEVREAGYMRQCPACNAQHYPRTDPVVIMWVHRGDYALLGRGTRFAAGTWSALAGFIEPGEPAEQAVRREVMEEAGIAVGKVRYLFSQPWPYPASLTFGFMAEAVDDAICIDGDELDDAQWFDRDQIAEMFARSGTPEAPRLSSPAALAMNLAETWLAGETA